VARSVRGHRDARLQARGLPQGEVLCRSWSMARAAEGCAAWLLSRWFADEQAEEVNTSGILWKFKLIGESEDTLFMPDSVLGERKAKSE